MGDLLFVGTADDLLGDRAGRYTYTHPDAYTDADAYLLADTDGVGHLHWHGDSVGNTNFNADADTYSDADAYADSDADTDADSRTDGSACLDQRPELQLHGDVVDRHGSRQVRVR
jgi:hypothetical protein